MNKYKITLTAALAALALTITVMMAMRRSPGKETFRWPVMGTIAQMTIRGNHEVNASAEKKILPVVRNAYVRINELLSAWNPDSELSKLAAAGCTNLTDCASPEVRPCYAAAIKLARESNNAFNPCVGATLRALGVSGGAPYSDFDLGAIAKGFAVDVAAEKIEAANANDMPDLMLDLGGNLRVVGNGVWRTGVRNPFDKNGDFIGIITLTNGESVATSGNYERFIERNGMRLSHILDGRTCKPTHGIAGVTVVTPRDYGAVLADGLSTTLFVLGAEEGAKFLELNYPRALALWIPDVPAQPRIIATKEMTKRLQNVSMPLLPIHKL